MYAAGEGYTAILRALHENGYKTKCGVDFKKNSLQSILTNKKYNGIYVYNRSSAKAPDGTRNSNLSKPEEEIITIPGGCPKIIDDDTFKAAQMRHSGPQRIVGGRNKAKRKYLLTGKVYCKECGKSMTGSARYSGSVKKFYTTYRCPSKAYCCSNKEINKDYLDVYVAKLLEKRIFNKASIASIVKKIDAHLDENSKEHQKHRNDLLSKLDETNTAMQRVADAVADGLISSALVERLNELEERKVELEAEISQLETLAGAITDLVNVDDIIPRYKLLRNSNNFLEYRSFLQRFISRIDVGRYMVDITLNTGLGIFDNLNTTISVKRQEIYEKKTAT